MHLRVSVAHVDFIIRPKLEPIRDIGAGLDFLDYYDLCGNERRVGRHVDGKGTRPIASELNVFEVDYRLASFLREHVWPH